MKKYLVLAMATMFGQIGLANAEAIAPIAYVSDQVLDTLRGRFLSAGQVTQFGVEMTSTWRNQEGALQGVAVVMQGAPSAQYTPTITTYRLSNGTTPTGSQTNVPAGLNTVQGIAQVNQIGGNGNSSSNQVNVTIRTGDMGSATINVGPGWTPSQGEGVTVAGNKLTTLIDMGPAGDMTQSLGNGQIQQFTRINTDGVLASNNLILYVTLNPTVATNIQSGFLQHMLTGLPGIH